MLRRAGRRWYRSMGWILFFTFLVTLVAGAYMRFYEPRRHVAEYTLCAVPRQEGQKPAPLSMWMLLGDMNRLLDDDTFRGQLVAQTPSDGKTFVSVRGGVGSHMVVVRAKGPDAAVVTGLANAVGDRLAADAVRLLGVASASTVHRAQLQPMPGTQQNLWRLAGVMLLAFAVFSLLAVLFGSRREPVRWNELPQNLALPAVGQVAACGPSCQACADALAKAAKNRSRKGGGAEKQPDCRLLTHVDRLVREGVDEVALALRTHARRHSCAIAVTGIRAEDGAPALAVLLGQTLAAEGYSVLMLELDGDQPALRRYLGVSGHVDVLDCIQDNDRLPQALLETGTPNLNLIDCCHDGEAVRRAAGSTHCRLFVRNALSVYDYVIISAPPASFGNGAAAVGSVADQTLLVAQDARYTAKELNAVAEGLHQRGAEVTGLVFVGVKKRQLRAVYREDGEVYRKEATHRS